MSDDRFFERLRSDAAPLRYEPRDEATWTRLQARIRERVAEPQPGVAQLLARWFRPLAVSLAALAIAGSLSLAWIASTEETASIESLSASSMEIVMGSE